MNHELLIGFLGTIFGAIGTYLAVVSFWTKREEELIKRIQEKTAKEVNMLRDYEGLKRNYAILSSSLSKISDEMDHKFELIFGELKEIRNSLKGND